MRQIALGAGGRMGVRRMRTLSGTDDQIADLGEQEAAPMALETEIGVRCVDRDSRQDGADAVILPPPDAPNGKTLRCFDRLPPGTAMIMLEAAAPCAGALPERAAGTDFVPACQPPRFRSGLTYEAQVACFGGAALVTARREPAEPAIGGSVIEICNPGARP